MLTCYQLKISGRCSLIMTLFLILNSVATILHAADMPVIPEAAGWGITTPAGRDGVIYKVTNLNADGPGSLRAAAEATEPRVIVFEVSGNILLSRNIRITHPYVTIAGQTAPSPGINLHGAGLVITAHDVLVQHIRFRIGDDPNGHNPDNRDGIGLSAGSGAVYNVVIDHCSIGWAIDGNIDLWYTPMHDISIRYCIISECLHDSTHPKGPHSTGLLIGDGAEKITVYANLMAHNHHRNPLMKQDTAAEIINNLVYNWGSQGIRTFAAANIIGNHLLPGPDTDPGARGINVYFGGEVPSLQPNTVFVADNIGPGRLSNTGDDWYAVAGDEKYRTRIPYIQRSNQTALDTDAVYAHVLEKAGARPADKDPVDERVVASVVSRNGRIIDSQTDVDGWPRLTTNHRPLTIPDNHQGDDDGDGYTNLEEWLHTMAAQVEGSDNPQDRKPAAPTGLAIGHDG